MCGFENDGGYMEQKFAQNRYSTGLELNFKRFALLFIATYFAQCVAKLCTYIAILLMELCTYINERCTYISILWIAVEEKKENTLQPKNDIKFMSSFHNDKKFCCRGFTFILLILSEIWKKILGVFPECKNLGKKNGNVRTSFQGVPDGQGVY